jgi:hypothetical protein
MFGHPSDTGSDDIVHFTAIGEFFDFNIFTIFPMHRFHFHSPFDPDADERRLSRFRI